MSQPGRRWLKLSARSASAGERAPLIAEALITLGGRGVVEQDGWFTSYFAEPDDLDVFLEHAQSVLETDTGLRPLSIEHAWQPHEEWAESWKRGLSERRITDRIVVHPSWIEPVEAGDGDIVIVLDPGMAFGTAEHGTTRGCLRLMDGLVERGDEILDVGAGSGILSVAAALLGASVVAIEGDGLACEAMAENLARNGVEDRVRIVQEWASSESLAISGPVSGIVANIESGLLRPLFPGCRDALAPGGWLLVSGILEHEIADITNAVNELGFVARGVDADGEWRSALFGKPLDPSAGRSGRSIP